ncbi:hypothetical protein [Kibdelosporangium philippinense]|uniref:hypothetical protein n=1 Tax=Kibdelosporangium philippinense TaxID=211113 RepID=UPI001F3869D8|nr:hypothetical protein [Kibdelosporangium philippinense]
MSHTILTKRGVASRGGEDAGYRGRELARNGAIGGLAVATGLRLQEFTFLSCLLCPLAVFAPHHAMNLLRLKAFFTRQWRVMPAAQFMAVFGAYAQRIHQILDRYEPEVVASAAAEVTTRSPHSSSASPSRPAPSPNSPTSGPKTSPNSPPNTTRSPACGHPSPRPAASRDYHAERRPSAPAANPQPQAQL